MKFINPRLAALARRVDPLWRLLAPLLPRPTPGAGLPRHVLVVDLHLLGDIVMLVPLLRVLRRCQPQARITLLAGPWSRAILDGAGLVDEHIDCEAPWVRRQRGLAGWRALARAVRRLRRGAGGAADGWDWGIDVRGDVRNILLLALAGARRRVAFDFTGGGALLTDVVPDDGSYRHIIEHHADLLRALGMPMLAEERVPRLPVPAQRPPRPVPAPSPLVGFHFGASFALRRVPIAEAAALVGALTGPGEVPLLIDAPDTRESNSALLARLSPELAARARRWEGGLRELMGLLSYLDRIYAVDSGPAHLAAALGTPTTVFFGPSLSVDARPLGAHVRIVERSDVACRPCDRIHCTNPNFQECLTHLVPLVTAPPTTRTRPTPGDVQHPPGAS